jgi:hypothetical protein
LASTQEPKRALPVKSTIAVRGSLMSRLPSGSAAVSRHKVTRSGSKPSAASVSRQILTAIAMGNTAVGCGFTMTGLPVARLANIAG